VIPRKYKSYGGGNEANAASRPSTSTAIESGAPGAVSDEIDLTLEQVKVAYSKFVPLAAIQYLMFLPEDVDRIDVNLLDRARTLLDSAFGPDREDDELEEREDEFRRRPDFDIDD